MGRTVETYPVNLSRVTGDTTGMKNRIRAAHPVRGPGQWERLAAAANWLRGRGGTLVGANGVNVSIGPGDSPTFMYRAWPRAEHATRLWIIGISTVGDGSAKGTISITAPSTAITRDFAIATSDTRLIEFPIIHTIDAATDVPETVAVQVATDSNSESSIVVQSISCHEVPRVQLGEGEGAELSSLYANRQIYEHATRNDDRGLEAVARHARYAKQVARKNHLFSWYYPTGVTSTSGSLVDLFPLYPFVCARLLESANTSRNIVWNAYALVTGGTATGEVAVTTAAGTTTMAVTSTGATWHADHTSSIETEDPTRWATDGGIRGGTRDTMQIQIRQTGATSITIFGFCAAEADNDPLTILGSP